MKKGLVFLLALVGSLLITGYTSSGKALATTAGSIALVNGTLIDGTGGPPLQDAVILINGERIIAVGTRSTLPPPAGYKIVDAQGGTILPGFINAHTHAMYKERSHRVWAQEGVTTIRELMSYPPLTSFAMRDKINQDPFNARLVAAGPQMTAVNGFAPAPRYSVYIDSKDEGIRQAERILGEGADLLKVMMESWNYPPLSVEIAQAIVETAHKHGKRASMHVSLCRDAEKALVIGCDDLAHMVIDELSPELAKKIAEAKIIWVPTIEAWNGLGYKKKAINNLRTFVAAGGMVALGTDFEGAKFYFQLGMPHKELGWMREAGMTPMQIIVASTRNAAQACGLGTEIGTVETGKLADLMIVAGDPLADLKALRQVKWVIHSGVIIKGQ